MISFKVENNITFLQLQCLNKDELSSEKSSFSYQIDSRNIQKKKYYISIGNFRKISFTYNNYDFILD